MAKNEWAGEFAGKKILIYGYGTEGKSTYAFIRSLLPEMPLTICDGGRNLAKAAGETVHTVCIGEENLHTEEFDLVMKAPGIVLGDDVDKKNISGQAQLFLKHYRHRTIGVTGTKGKSTTVSLIAALLANKYPVELVGNIGRSCFDAIEQMEEGALAVFELSCHQLEFCSYSPRVAVFLNLYEEHLDHYGSLARYGAAKSHILMYQKEGDTAIIDQDLPAYISLARNPILIGKDIYNEGKTLHIPGKALTITDCQLKGEHNYRNLAVSWYIADRYGIDGETVKKTAAQFKPLAHRLEDIGVYEGIRYVNDSISTIPQAAIRAVEAVDNAETLLIGGMDRGISYTELEKYIGDHPDLNAIMMYASGKRIYEEIKEKGLFRKGLYYVDDLAEGVSLARRITRPGHTILLSPAAPSYDHFKNFEERGDVFRSLARMK